VTTATQEMRIDPEEMRDAARRLLADKLDRRAAWEGKSDANKGLDAEIGELGWYQLNAQEELGGLGQTFEALGPVYEELGKSLAPLWLSGTLATIDALQSSGGDAAQLVKDIIEQGWRVAPVILPRGMSMADARLPMVPGAAEASHLLIVEESGSALIVEASAPGISVSPVQTWDLGRSYGEVVLSGPEGGQASVDAGRALPVLRAHLELAIAWDSIGGGLQCLTETVEYMLGRQQFGRPIASFQALKHRAADHKVNIELARSLAVRATSLFADKADGWATVATQARILAGEAYAAMAEDCVQLFGGVGFTWEYNAHLFLKRALVNQLVGGSPDELRDRVAEEVCRRALDSRPA